MSTTAISTRSRESPWTIKRGEIVTLIGANGAGKSTTLNSISGLVRPRSGAIHYDGREITNVPAHKTVTLGLSQSPEGRKIFPRMSVRENLEMGAFSRSGQNLKDDFERTYDLFPVLRERRNQPGGTLSGGEQQMLAMGRALMAQPKLLMLDEPSMGLAPMLVEKIFQIIQEINEQGMTILLVEQNANVALEISHRGYVMETGTIVLTADSPGSAQQSPGPGSLSGRGVAGALSPRDSGCRRRRDLHRRGAGHPPPGL